MLRQEIDYSKFSNGLLNTFINTDGFFMGFMFFFCILFFLILVILRRYSQKHNTLERQKDKNFIFVAAVIAMILSIFCVIIFL